ncbi:ExbD/TolR family protein [Microbacter margulisiae]|uniref:Biopolymer transport protein ExbD n=1 Tax=Microbacter margulisiae TaxID=1350067 RepID=A0A7W5DNK3_9PORP|nr:biopolymer transporter ExbD [Microbacter margulisiae]MBB3185895.1 biopolymer transport protein ExbD [Microbacter margulisiae]
MAEIIQEEKRQKGGKKRPRRGVARVDMTPMVDLMALLLTFFMLTTAFNKPKIMVITMPEKDNKPHDQPKIDAKRTLNILLGDSDRVYYYMGIADPNKPLPTLIKTNFSKDGLRRLLLEKNRALFTKIVDYKSARAKGRIVVADTTAENYIKQLKIDDNVGPIVLIKPDVKAKYKDVVATIDEMSICNIASYAIVDLSPTEKDMLKSAPR